MGCAEQTILPPADHRHQNERDELGAVQSALSQLIFNDELRETLKENPALGFAIPDELEAI